MSQEEVTKISSIDSLRESSGRISVRFKVLESFNPRVVTSRRTGKKHLIGEHIVADETARILLTLWNEDADLVEEGAYYLLLNGRVQVFDYSMRLAKGMKGRIEQTSGFTSIPNPSLDMSKPFMGREKKKRRRLKTQGRTFYGVPGRRSRGYCSEKDY